MAWRYSDAVLSAVRERTDIAELIGNYVQLERRGSALKALCPFHEEKTPSFNVNRDRGFFKCFGCGEGGDAFKFLMRMEGLSFTDAVKELADRAGVEVEEREVTPQMAQEQDRRKRLLSLNEWALGWFRSNLRGPAGEAAKNHVAERKLKGETVERYAVGAAPDSWDSLAKAARARGAENDAVDVGLLVRGNTGRVYDRLRDRVIFPIRDVRGRTVGFGGRALGDDPAKYLNSPDSPVYDKSRILYGLFEARLAIGRADLAILCEGYFDVMAVSDAGFENAVATCGTALTKDQVRLIKRYTNNVALLFDSDEAGRNAAKKALPQFLDQDMWPTRVVLEDAKDPDDYLRKFGAEALRSVIEAAPPLVDVVADEAVDALQGDPRAPELLIAAIATVLDRMSTAGQRRLIARAAQRLNRNEHDLRREWERYHREAAAKGPAESRAPGSFREEPLEAESAPGEPAIPEAEARLLQLFVLDPDLTAQAVYNYDGDVLSMLETPAVERFLRTGIEHLTETGRPPDPASLLDPRAGDALQPLVAEVLVAESDDSRTEHLVTELAERLIRIEIASQERSARDFDLAYREAKGREPIDREYLNGLIRSKEENRRRIQELRTVLARHQVFGDFETRLQHAAQGR